MADDFVDLPTSGMIDIMSPSDVEVKVRLDGKILWVNVNGVCRLRARVQHLDLIDERAALDTPKI